MLTDRLREFHPERNRENIGQIEEAQHKDRHIFSAKDVSNKEDVERRCDIESDRSDHEGHNQPFKRPVAPHELQAVHHFHPLGWLITHLLDHAEGQNDADRHQHQHGDTDQLKDHCRTANHKYQLGD